MKKRWIISLPVFVFTILSANAFAAQYENYEWGMSKEEAIKRIRDNGYVVLENNNYEKDNVENVLYKDKLFKDVLEINLFFTPTTKKLYNIMITCDREKVGKDLKPVLEKKYGEPKKIKGYENRYEWQKNGFSYLNLQYGDEKGENVKTFLLYISEKYYRQYLREDRKLKEQKVYEKF